jgi:hypothetical protein
MPTFYIDETGFTGQDLMAADQPIFVQATNNLTDDETNKLIAKHFNGVRAEELKHKNLSRKIAGQDKIVDLVTDLVSKDGRAATWIAHKEFAAVTMVVEWWIEPLAHRWGINLYENGMNHAMANMLFFCLQGFWDDKFRRKLLLSFQKMVRARTQERFEEFESFIRKTRENFELDKKRYEIIQYLWPSFALLGIEHVKHLPDHVLDIALPGLVRIGHFWRAKNEGPWEVIHDRSTSLAKQKWLWDKLSASDLGNARFEGPGGAVAIFPMNVTNTRFVDSIDEKQIQICDLLAGATSAFARLPEDDDYKEKLRKAGIEALIIDSIWPRTAVTPEELGKKGWDGNIAIEWISAASKAKDQKSTSGT